MKMKKRLCMMLAVMMALGAMAATEESTEKLRIFTPQFSRIDLVCGTMPTTTDSQVDFCCEAVFTGELLEAFKHTNIADNHISSGVMHKGYKCRANSGGFTWGTKGWRFMRKVDFPAVSIGLSMGFCQLLIVLDGQQRPISERMRKKTNVYRALCEKDGKLCLIEAKEKMTYEAFVKCLMAYEVKHALYLDMGSGWNYAWYRDKTGRVKELFPLSKQSPSYKYRTNWITFYR